MSRSLAFGGWRARAFLCFALGGAGAGCGDDSDGSGASGGGGAGQGGGEGAAGPDRLGCAFEGAAPLCEGAGCPLSGHGRLRCNGYVAVELGATAAGAAVLGLDPSLPGDSVAADTVRETIEPLGPTAGVIAATVDESGAMHWFDSGTDSEGQWVHRVHPGGAEDTVASDPPGYFTSRAAASVAGTVAAIALHDRGDAEELWLATRDGGGSWDARATGVVAPGLPTLELADDGTPLLGYFVPQAGAWSAHVIAGDEPPSPLPFDVGAGLIGELYVVPGPDGWKAAVTQVGAGIHVIMPGFGQATLASSSPIFFESCVAAAQQLGGRCSGTCSESAQGARPSFAAIPTAAGILVAFVEVSVDRTYSFAEGECTEAGCPCGASLRGDASTSELVLVRFNSGAEGLLEVGRFAMEGGPASVVSLQSSRRGDKVALAWVDETSTTVSYATLDLAALP